MTASVLPHSAEFVGAVVVGAVVGFSVAASVGALVGAAVGFSVGALVGAASVAAAVVGAFVGAASVAAFVVESGGELVEVFGGELVLGEFPGFITKMENSEIFFICT